MKKNKKLTKYLITFFSIVICYLIFSIIFSLTLNVPDGALTRIGFWPEKYYKWNDPQPHVNIKKNGKFNSKLLILGDSFSDRNIWQSFLKDEYEISIQTFHFKDVGCMDNWFKKIEQKKLIENKYIIIQVVEQSFLSLFRTLGSCNQKIEIQPLYFKEGNIYPNQTIWGKLIFDVNYLTKTIFNILRVNNDKKIIQFGGVDNVLLKNSNLFSNINSHRMLYLNSENEKEKWNINSFRNIAKEISKKQSDLKKLGIKLIILIIPDKSTQYSIYIDEEAVLYNRLNLFELLNRTDINHINTYKEFTMPVKEKKDFYLPNDNHLSFKGYKVLSKIVQKYLAQ